MMATLVAEPFDSSEHLFEVKWDGMRVIAFIDNGNVRLQSRNLRDVTSYFPELATLPRHVAGRRAVLDGVAEEILGDPRLRQLGVAPPAAVELRRRAEGALLPPAALRRLEKALAR